MSPQLRFLLLFLFPVFFGLFSPRPASAACYYLGDPNYASCAGGGNHTFCCPNMNSCPSLGNPVFACCNNSPVPDVCPPQNPLTPTPTIDPNSGCGHTSEPCCTGGTCLVPDLSCIYTAAGYRCLSAAQCNLLPGGCPHPTPGDNVEIYCNDEIGVIRTAVGCVRASDSQALIVQLISWAIKIGSGILFLNIVYAGFLFVTAAGKEDQVKDASHLLSTSILGFLVVATAVLLLNFFGVRVLNLQFFGFGL